MMVASTIRCEAMELEIAIRPWLAASGPIPLDLQPYQAFRRVIIPAKQTQFARAQINSNLFLNRNLGHSISKSPAKSKANLAAGTTAIGDCGFRIAGLKGRPGAISSRAPNKANSGARRTGGQRTEDFLRFSRARGNDLSTPQPDSGFPGLRPGDRWCLCAARWQEALEAGLAPPVVLAATHMSALEFVDLEDLRAHALDEETDPKGNA